MAEDFRIQFQDSGDQPHGRDLRSQSEKSRVHESRLQNISVLPEIVIDAEDTLEVRTPFQDSVAEGFPQPPDAEEQILREIWRSGLTGTEFKVDLSKAPVRLDLATLRAVPRPFDGTNLGFSATVAGLTELADRVERVRKCQKLEGTIMSAEEISDTAAGVENFACAFGRHHLDRFVPKSGAISTGGNEFILGLRMRDGEHKLTVGLKVTLTDFEAG
ncbi:MAG: hypothetical protein K2W95_21340 [Candidatus Obscuribacterales bacterium]|nr:hypothetical protein [Candidatus Obscuribacterales bacterium]